MADKDVQVAAAIKIAADRIGAAYSWLVYFSHHDDGSMRCAAPSCAKCEAREAAKGLEAHMEAVSA